MATKLTDTGVEFPGNGTDPVEQSKAIKNVEGNEADSTGKITLSTVSGKTLDERLTEIEELGSGGGAVYLEQNTFGTNNYMFKDSYWWGGESVYSYSSASSTQQTAIENLERGNVLNLSAPNSSEYYHVSSVDSANKRITLIRGTFNDRSNQDLTIDDAENGTFSDVNLTHVSSVTPAVTTGSWLQIEAGSNYSGSTISTTNGIGFAPMNLSTLPSEATHILFRVTSETSGHLIIYNREHFLTRSSSAPILESEKVHQVDVESSGSQSSSDEFWVPNNSFLQFWLTGSGTAHLYPVAYAVMDLSKVNLDGASIPAVNALSDEIIDLQNQVNSNDVDISALQQADVVSSVNTKTGDLTVSAGTGISVTSTTDGIQISTSGSGGVSSLNNKTGDLTVSAGTGIGVTSTSNGLQISNSGVTSVNGSTGAVDLSNTYYTQTEVNNIVSSSGGGGGGNYIGLSEAESLAGSFAVATYRFRGGVLFSYDTASGTNLTTLQSLPVGRVCRVHFTTENYDAVVTKNDTSAKKIQFIFLDPELAHDLTNLLTTKLDLRDHDGNIIATGVLLYDSGIVSSGASINNQFRKWMKVEAGIDNSLKNDWDTVSQYDSAVNHIPANLSHIPTNATHIVFEYNACTRGFTNWCMRENFNNRPEDFAPHSYYEKIISLDNEGTTSYQCQQGSFIVPNGSYVIIQSTNDTSPVFVKPIGYIVEGATETTYTKTQIDNIVSSSSGSLGGFTSLSENTIVDLDNWTSNHLNLCSFTVPSINDFYSFPVCLEYCAQGFSKKYAGNRWGSYIESGIMLVRSGAIDNEIYPNISSYEWRPRTAGQSNNHYQYARHTAVGGISMVSNTTTIVDNSTNICTIYLVLGGGGVGSTHNVRLHISGSIIIKNSVGNNSISNFQWNFTEGPSSLPQS